MNLQKKTYFNDHLMSALFFKKNKQLIISCGKLNTL